MSKNPFEVYNDVASEVRDVIIMARQGRHREGHLTFVIKALQYLRQFGLQIGKSPAEIDKIDKLISEFEAQLSYDEVDSKSISPLDALFEEEEDGKPESPEYLVQ